MRVLLVNPPVDLPSPVMPLGLAYLAAALRERGTEVAVVDAWAERLGFDEIARRARSCRPDVVGVTITTPVLDSAMKTVRSVKAATGALVVVGGPHPSALPEACLRQNSSIDYVAIGEGERTINAIVELAAKRTTDPSAIRGLAFRSGAEIVRTGPAELVRELDTLPRPARDLFPLARYRSHLPYGRRSPYVTLMTSRGCPYPCIFCSKAVFGDRYRTMSPARVADEVAHILRTYRAREIRFYDDDFTIDMKRAEAICDEMIGRRLVVDWSCTTRVDLVTDSLLRKMKLAGCWAISYGVESGNAAILRAAKKSYTLEKVRAAFGMTRRHGMRTLGFFMLGLPGETEETARQTIDLALELDPDFASWSITRLLPGSKMYEEVVPAESGKNGSERAVSRLSAPSSYPVYTGALSERRLNELATQAQEAFYLRPRFVARTLRHMTSMAELSAYASAGIGLVRSLARDRLAPRLASRA